MFRYQKAEEITVDITNADSKWTAVDNIIT